MNFYNEVRKQGAIDWNSPVSQYLGFAMLPNVGAGNILSDLITGTQLDFTNGVTWNTDGSVTGQSSASQGNVLTVADTALDGVQLETDSLILAVDVYYGGGSGGFNQRLFTVRTGNGDDFYMRSSSWDDGITYYGQINYSSAISPNMYNPRRKEFYRATHIIHWDAAARSWTVYRDGTVDHQETEGAGTLSGIGSIQVGLGSQNDKIYSSQVLTKNGSFTQAEIDEVINNPYGVFQTSQDVQNEYGLIISNTDDATTAVTFTHALNETINVVLTIGDGSVSGSNSKYLFGSTNSTSYMKINGNLTYDTRHTNVKVDGVPVASNTTSADSLLIKGAVLSFDLLITGGTIILGNSAAYTRAARVGVADITIIDSLGHHYWDFNQTHGDTVTDKLNGSIATLVNFPADSGYIEESGQIVGYQTDGVGLTFSIPSTTLVGAFNITFKGRFDETASNTLCGKASSDRGYLRVNNATQVRFARTVDFEHITATVPTIPIDTLAEFGLRREANNDVYWFFDGVETLLGNLSGDFTVTDFAHKNNTDHFLGLFEWIKVTDDSTLIRHYDFTTGNIDMLAGGTYSPWVNETIGGNIGELIGGVTYDETGATFDGSTGYVTHSGFNIDSGDDFSIRIKASSASNSEHTRWLGGSSIVSTTPRVIYLATSGTVRITFDGLAKEEWAIGLDATIHQEIEFRRTSGNLDLYVAGVLQSGGYDSETAAFTNSKMIGHNYSAFTQQGLLEYIEVDINSTPVAKWDFTDILQVQDTDSGSIVPAIEETVQGLHAEIVNPSTTKWQRIIEKQVYTLGVGKDYSDTLAFVTATANLNDSTKTAIIYGNVNCTFNGGDSGKTSDTKFPNGIEYIGDPEFDWKPDFNLTGMPTLVVNTAIGVPVGARTTYFKVKGLKVDGSLGLTSSHIQSSVWNSGCDWQIEEVLIDCADTSGSCVGLDIGNNAVVNAKAKRVVVRNSGGHSFSATIFGSLSCVECISIDGNKSNSGYRAGFAKVLANNCISKGNLRKDFYSSTKGNNNISSDGTAVGDNSQTNVDFTGAFVDETNGDYRINQAWAEDGAKGNLIGTGWNGSDIASWAYVELAVDTITAVISGTATPTMTEVDVGSGGNTLIVTIAGDTWNAAGSAFDDQRQAIINGLVSAQSETTGWNNEVQANELVTSVVRDSDTQITITLSAAVSYDITATETVTTTVPASALATSTSDVIADSTFTITATSTGFKVVWAMKANQLIGGM